MDDYEKRIADRLNETITDVFDNYGISDVVLVGDLVDTIFKYFIVLNKTLKEGDDG